MKWLIGEDLFGRLSGSIYQGIGLRPNLLANLLDTLLVFIVYLLLRRWLKGLFLPRISEIGRRYVVSKTISYTLSVILLGFMASIWVKAEVDLATYFGILSAGLAIALQDAVANLAGWIFLVIRQPLKVGDRIQIGQHAGDVIDIQLFMFSMLEIGAWVAADQSTGRIIHVPNGRLFKEPLINYTHGFDYIWNEIPVTVTFESDWRKAQKILTDIAYKHSEKLDERMSSQITELADTYRVHFTHLTPIVWVRVVDMGVTLTIRYLSHPRKRRSSEDTIWKAILEAFEGEPAIDFAYPTQRFFCNSQEGKPGVKSAGPTPEALG